MEYSTEIINAHAAWRKAEANIPESEFAKGYKSREAKAKKLWKSFDELCVKNGLRPVAVDHDIIKPVFRVK